MNIIKKMQTILEAFPKIDNLHVDYNEDAPDSFGLYPTGDKLVSEDILGNQDRSHTFILFANFQSLNDYDRLQNSGLLLELQHWFESGYWYDFQYEDNEISTLIDGDIFLGEIKGIKCANGIVFDVPDQNLNSTVRYQLQITVDYYIAYDNKS